MTLAGLLADVVARLERSRVPYMLTGSLASSYHGEPRATFDIDVVIDPTPHGLDALVDELQAGGYDVDADVARTAVAERTQFNAISPDAAEVDLIVRHDRPFSAVEFSRREEAALLMISAFVATAEDLVVAKLEWARAAGSERQVQDAAGIVAITEDLDIAYIDRWTAELGVGDLWAAIRPDEAAMI